MRLVFFILVSAVILLIPGYLLSKPSDIFPLPDDSLSFRLIGFEVAPMEGIASYELEIWKGKAPDRKREWKSPHWTLSSTSPRWIQTLPSFGETYFWRVGYRPRRGKVEWTPLHRFHIQSFPRGGMPKTRVRVLNRDSSLEDLFVFFDNHRALYNLDGEPVWHLPLIEGITDSLGGDIRDLKITPDGTISFLTDRNAFEISYRGEILWSAPIPFPENAQIYRHYHHEFEKLKDGSFRILGNELTPMTDENHPDQEREATCSTIMEFDSEGKRTWSWNSCEALGLDDPVTHFNAFYFHEPDSSFYVSFRNTNTVMKIDYPGGNILKEYKGARHQPHAFDLDGLFYYQHYCRISSDGYLMLFNNNFKPFLSAHERNALSIPSVVMFEETQNPHQPLKKVWEYSTAVDSEVDPTSSGGGSFMELKGKRYLVCTGTPGRNFIVDREKNLLWNVLTEKWTHDWVPFPGYRVSALYPEDLPRLLFNRPLTDNQ